MQIFNNKLFSALYSCGSYVLQGISIELGHVWEHLTHTPLMISPSSIFALLVQDDRCSQPSFEGKLVQVDEKNNRSDVRGRSNSSVKSVCKDDRRSSPKENELRDLKATIIEKHPKHTEALNRLFRENRDIELLEKALEKYLFFTIGEIDLTLESSVKQKDIQFKEMKGDATIKESNETIDTGSQLVSKIQKSIKPLMLEETSNYGVFINKINLQTSNLFDDFLDPELKITSDSLKYFQTIFKYLIDIKNEKDQSKRNLMYRALCGELQIKRKSRENV